MAVPDGETHACVRAPVKSPGDLNKKSRPPQSLSPTPPIGSRIFAAPCSSDSGGSIWPNSSSRLPGAPAPWSRDFPKTDIEHAELQAFAAAAAGVPAYPLPLEEAVHGVSVFETMIGAAASGSRYAVP